MSQQEMHNMVHGWYQSPFPTHTLKCPQSDERDHTACSSATEQEGVATQRRFMGINESPDRFVGKPTIQKTTASSFSRLGLCALTI